MLERCELDHVHLVAGGLKPEPSERVGKKLRELVLEYPVFEPGIVYRLLYLSEKLVLAAGYAEDDPAVPPDGIYQGIVSGCVTGMGGVTTMSAPSLS